jgi:hypothetical protein
MASGSGMRPALALLLGVLLLTACGKKGAPTPAGPPDQVTWPRIYPTH